jgi:hypothetical protein
MRRNGGVRLGHLRLLPQSLVQQLLKPLRVGEDIRLFFVLTRLHFLDCARRALGRQLLRRGLYEVLNHLTAGAQGGPPHVQRLGLLMMRRGVGRGYSGLALLAAHQLLRF